MKEIFIMWITIQLIVIGMSSVDILNRVHNNTYVCPKKEYMSPLYGAFFPLVLFTGDVEDITNYCKNYDTKSTK